MTNEALRPGGGPHGDRRLKRENTRGAQVRDALAREDLGIVVRQLGKRAKENCRGCGETMDVGEHCWVDRETGDAEMHEECRDVPDLKCAGCCNEFSWSEIGGARQLPYCPRCGADYPDIGFNREP